jgi:uncharacterized protein YutE (UPF0331/DUF86 family)
MQIQPENNISSHSLKWIIYWLIIGFFLSTLIFSIIGHAIPTLTLNENQVLYLFSTSSQVLAAIYGLTLTGLVFFINELNREQAEDETKEASTRELKSRYYYFLLFITISVGTTICLGNAAISTEAIGSGIINAIIINAGQSAFVFSLLAISIFIFEVIDPQALERASDRVKENLDPAIAVTERGSLEDFIRNFNSIEAALQKYGEAYQYDSEVTIFSESISASQVRSRRRLSNARLAEILLRNGKINQYLFVKIKELISIRNSIVHGADPVVSQHIVNESISVLNLLKDALGLG